MDDILPLGSSWRHLKGNFLSSKRECEAILEKPRDLLIFHTSARESVLCLPSSIRYMSYANTNVLASLPFFFLLLFLLWSHKGKLVCRVEGRGEWGSHSRFIRGDFGVWGNVMQTRILKHRKKLEMHPAQEEHRGNKSKRKITFPNTNQMQGHAQKDLYIFLQMALWAYSWDSSALSHKIWRSLI